MSSWVAKANHRSSPSPNLRSGLGTLSLRLPPAGIMYAPAYLPDCAVLEMRGATGTLFHDVAANWLKSPVS